MHRRELERLVGAREGRPARGRGCRRRDASSRPTSPPSSPTPTRVIFLEDGDVADLLPSGVRITDVAGAELTREVTTDRPGRPRRPRRAATGTSWRRRSSSSPSPSASRSPGGSGAMSGSRSRRSSHSTEVLRRGRSRGARGLRLGVLRGPDRRGRAPGLGGHPGPGDGRLGVPLQPTAARRQNTLVIAVTQSGETADTIAPTRYAREQGSPVIAVTNTVGSAITREADAVLFLQAGPEIAVAARRRS